MERNNKNVEKNRNQIELVETKPAKMQIEPFALAIRVMRSQFRPAVRRFARTFVHSFVGLLEHDLLQTLTQKRSVI